MPNRTARHIETRRKKARRAIPRPKLTRSQGNTVKGRNRMKKLAGLRRGAAAPSPQA